jgi:diguanylate cyclase (GGDEF)-like protein
VEALETSPGLSFMFAFVRRPRPETLSVVAIVTGMSAIATLVILLSPAMFADSVSWAMLDVALAGFALGSVLTTIVLGPIYIRARRISEASARHAHGLAAMDQMTGLLNRGGFFVAAEQMVASTVERGLSASLLYVDLDHFKELNDSYGHGAGDALLKSVAERMRSVCGERALLGRLGGDEFAVCLPDLLSMEEADELAGKLTVALAEPIVVLGHGIVPSASIGYALSPQDADRIGDLARAADLALYSAKTSGRGQHRGFEPYLMLELDQRREIERLVREATATNNFELHYQPLVHAGSGRLAGFEALLRLRTEQGRYISPAIFIPVAEEIGIISQIGRWVLDNACQTARLWPDHLKLAVNLSPLQFRDFSIADTVKEVLRSTGFPAERLQLEITEGLLLLKSDDIMNQLLVLKEFGIELAMDDFGSGYCSLSYLWKFPFDTIKIDRSFVQALDDPHAPASNVLASVLGLAQSLRLSVTVEGIETEAQAAHVRALGCDTLQGFLFSPPLSLADCAAYILADAAKGIHAELPKGRKARSLAA